MSTQWYPFKYPITGVVVKKWSVTVFVNTFRVGQLNLEPADDEIREFLLAIRDDLPIFHTYNGGAHRGIMISYYNQLHENLQDYLDKPDDYSVISEYGEVLTVREVIALKGKGKKESTDD